MRKLSNRAKRTAGWDAFKAALGNYPERALERGNKPRGGSTAVELKIHRNMLDFKKFFKRNTKENSELWRDFMETILSSCFLIYNVDVDWTYIAATWWSTMLKFIEHILRLLVDLHSRCLLHMYCCWSIMLSVSNLSFEVSDRLAADVLVVCDPVFIHWREYSLHMLVK